METSRLVLLFAVLAGGCVASLGQAAGRDLRKVPPDKLILVGTLRVYQDGHDQTERTAFEVTGGGGGFQLSASGDVVWVIDRPPPGTPVRLTWLSTFETAQTFGDAGLVLSPADATEPCIYFGDVTVRMGERVIDPTAEAVVGWSFPRGEVRVADREEVTIPRLAQVNPTLRSVSCGDGVPRVATGAVRH